MSVKEKVKGFIRKWGLLEEGDRVLLGLSGGADSVCLFYLLLELREELGLALRVVHVHHGIRTEADQDVSYVKKLCEKEDVFCYMFREDVPACAEKQGLSLEEAGRILRYQDFQESLGRWQKEECEIYKEQYVSGGQICSARYKIATAHHENDQAETVLFQLFRGCGLAGLRGILPRRENVIRPLLCLSREEIEEFLRERGISWCEDETNKAEDYSRNKIRCRIIPYAEREICRGITGHIGKTAEILREVEEYIRKQVREAYRKTALEQEGIVVFDIISLQKEDIFLQKQLLFYGLERILAARKDIGAVHMEEILGLVEKQGNGELFLPQGVRIRKVYHKLLLFREGEKDTLLSKILSENRKFLCGGRKPEIKMEKIDLSEKEVVKARFGLQKFSEIMGCIPQKEYTKWFDYDKIKMPFSVRHREIGDYLTIDGEMNHKSFRRYMIENKIPVSDRDRIWLLADGSHVIWVPGGRISTYYKVTDQTKTILQIQICVEE